MSDTINNETNSPTVATEAPVVATDAATTPLAPTAAPTAPHAPPVAPAPAQAAPAATAPVAAKSESSTFGTVLTSALTSLAVCALCLFYYHTHVAQHIAGYDLKGYYGFLKQQVIDGKMTEEDAGKRIKAAAEKIAAQPGNKVVISTEVLLGGKFENIPVQ